MILKPIERHIFMLGYIGIKNPSIAKKRVFLAYYGAFNIDYLPRSTLGGNFFLF